MLRIKVPIRRRRKNKRQGRVRNFKKIPDQGWMWSWKRNLGKTIMGKRVLYQGIL